MGGPVRAVREHEGLCVIVEARRLVERQLLVEGGWRCG